MKGDHVSSRSVDLELLDIEREGLVRDREIRSYPDCNARDLVVAEVGL